MADSKFGLPNLKIGTQTWNSKFGLPNLKIGQIPSLGTTYQLVFLTSCHDTVSHINIFQQDVLVYPFVFLQGAKSRTKSFELTTNKI